MGENYVCDRCSCRPTVNEASGIRYPQNSNKHWQRQYRITKNSRARTQVRLPQRRKSCFDMLNRIQNENLPTRPERELVNYYVDEKHIEHIAASVTDQFVREIMPYNVISGKGRDRIFLDSEKEATWKPTRGSAR